MESKKLEVCPCLEGIPIGKDIQRQVLWGLENTIYNQVWVSVNRPVKEQIRSQIYG